jgi:hypothetical protein
VKAACTAARHPPPNRDSAAGEMESESGRRPYCAQYEGRALINYPSALE